MTARPPKRNFVGRPTDPERWVKASDAEAKSYANGQNFTARLTIDVTPDLRGRIKIAAFHRGLTVADMLRDLLARTFPETEGEAR